MLNSISWTHYFGIVVLLLIAYYLYIGAKFYSSEFHSFLSRKSILQLSSATDKTRNKGEGRNNSSKGDQSEVVSDHSRYTPQTQETDKTFEAVEELAARLKEFVADSVANESNKEQFINSLQIVLKNYQFLKRSAFLIAINNLITSECDKHSFIHLTDEELVTIWDN